MKLFGFLLVCLTLLLSASANPIEPRVPDPDPHWWNDLENWAKGVVNDLTDAGKSVWNGLKKAEQKALAAEKSLEKDGCKIVPCALELGITTTKCVIAARQYGGNAEADKKCLASVRAFPQQFMLRNSENEAY